MSNQIIDARFTLCSDTTEALNASSKVLLKGEPAIELTGTIPKFKFGDGLKTFKQLPYVTLTLEEIQELVTITATHANGDILNAITSAFTVESQKKYDDAVVALDEKASIKHIHASDDIESLDVSKLTGVIDLKHIPTGALERCCVVADDVARFALTKNDAQKGDTVKVTATDKMYFIIDDTKLSSDEGYMVYSSGSAASVPWSGIIDKPDSFVPSVHTHTISSVTGLQESLNSKASVSQGTKADTALQSIKINGVLQSKTNGEINLPTYPTTMSTDNLTQESNTLIFNCGNSSL